MTTLTQVTPEAGPEGAGGLRSRKKDKTRLALEDAALDLFAEKGFDAATVDEITQRAEVSKATFFRYFASKADVVFGVESLHLEALQAAIVARPKNEPDLSAIRHAVLTLWVPKLDPVRVARQGRAAATSSVLRGMSFDLGMRWQRAIAAALAQRRGVEMDRRCWVVAGIALSVFSNALNCWLYRGEPADLHAAVDATFDLIIDACADAARA
jgi:AcrR family transcriptional regulator